MQYSSTDFHNPCPDVIKFPYRKGEWSSAPSTALPLWGQYVGRLCPPAPAAVQQWEWALLSALSHTGLADSTCNQQPLVSVILREKLAHTLVAASRVESTAVFKRHFFFWQGVPTSLQEVLNLINSFHRRLLESLFLQILNQTKSAKMHKHTNPFPVPLTHTRSSKKTTHSIFPYWTPNTSPNTKCTWLHQHNKCRKHKGQLTSHHYLRPLKRRLVHDFSLNISISNHENDWLLLLLLEN